MARTNPVPEREREIGRRLLEFRRSTRRSRASVAEQLGIGASRLKSYERGDVPLSYLVAHKLNALLGLSHSWLATGTGPMRDPFSFAAQEHAEIHTKAAFSAVYDALNRKRPELPALISKHLTKLKAEGIEVTPIRELDLAPEATLTLIGKTAGAVLDCLPPSLCWAYYRRLSGASEEFRQENAAQILAWQSAQGQNGGNKNNEKLTYGYALRNISDVQSKPSWPWLVKNLINATKARGKKAELAREIGVPLPRISELLAGKWEPGGERTLLLLQWVQKQEKTTNQKGPGGAYNTARAETRPRPQNAKPKSGPT